MNKITVDWLRQKYWDEELSMSKMAGLAGVTTATIRYHMQKFNIPRRTRSEAASGKKNPFWGKKHSLGARQRMSVARRGRKTWNWQGGRKHTTAGYVHILNREHPYSRKDGYIAEHRLVMEGHLGRYLNSWEIVHHKNGIKDDNRIENLELFPEQTTHLSFQKLRQEKLKYEYAFYRIVGLWLANQHQRLTGVL